MEIVVPLRRVRRHTPAVIHAALVVGALLNLINQGDALLGVAPVNWFKIVLTYFVPYVVCTYGAVSSQRIQGLNQ